MGNVGQENLKGWANSTPKANNEKLKRQRSSLPEIGETSEFSSPEDAQNSENTGLQIPPSGGIQTRSKGTSFYRFYSILGHDPKSELSIY